MNQSSNRYAPPTANVDAVNSDEDNFENTSGMGKDYPLPDGVKGWSWGAFLLSWIWAIGNKNWFGLLALLPYVGFIFALVQGVNGRERAWRNKRWDSLEHFNRVQRRWSMWGLIVVGGICLLGILAAIVIPMYARYSR